MQIADLVDEMEAKNMVRREEEFFRQAIGVLFNLEENVVSELQRTLNEGYLMIKAPIHKNEEQDGRRLGDIAFDFGPMHAECMLAHSMIALSGHILSNFAKEIFQSPFPPEDFEWSWRDPSSRIMLRCCYGIVRSGIVFDAQPGMSFQRVLEIVFEPAREETTREPIQPLTPELTKNLH